MTKFYNLTEYKNKRRNLRKKATPAEGIFWSHIRNRQLEYKFKRQYSVGNYILDFYCPELKIAVEIDGGGHYEEANIKRDLLRTKYLEEFGIKVKRYTNLDVKNNLESAIIDLMIECEKRK